MILHGVQTWALLWEEKAIRKRVDNFSWIMCQKLYMCGVCQNTVGEVNNYKSSETLYPVWIVHEIDAEHVSWEKASN